jgi:hypothetical protein
VPVVPYAECAVPDHFGIYSFVNGTPTTQALEYGAHSTACAFEEPVIAATQRGSGEIRVPDRQQHFDPSMGRFGETLELEPTFGSIDASAKAAFVSCQGLDNPTVFQESARFELFMAGSAEPMLVFGNVPGVTRTLIISTLSSMFAKLGVFADTLSSCMGMVNKSNISNQILQHKQMKNSLLT